MKEDPLDVESTLASLEERLSQFESEINLELAYKT